MAELREMSEQIANHLRTTPYTSWLAQKARPIGVLRDAFD